MTGILNQLDGEDRDLRDQLLAAAIPHVMFDGWGHASLKLAAEDLEMPVSDAIGLFPGGAGDMIAWYSRRADQRMMDALADMDLDTMKIREKIKTAVRLRLEQNAADRDALARGMSFLSLPQNACLSTKLLYHTVDDIWYMAGDRSTDWNYYSKRALLAGVFSSTILCWLSDDSDGFEETWAFLDRRIENVMQIPKITSKISKAFGNIGGRFDAFKHFRPRNFGS